MSIKNCSLAYHIETKEEQDCEIQEPELSLLVGKALKSKKGSFLQNLFAEEKISAVQVTGRITVSF